MNAMLANPNLTPIGYTNKKFVQQQMGIPGMGGAPPPAGAPGGPMIPGMGQMPPVPGAPGVEGVAPAPQEGMTAALQAEEVAAAQAGQMGQASAFGDQVTTKSLWDEWDEKAENSLDRWTEILDSSLERFVERQQRVILEKAAGSKSRKSLEAGSLDYESIFDQRIWDKQLAEDMRPILSGIMNDAATLVSQEVGMQAEIDEKEAAEHLKEQIERFQQMNATTAKEIEGAVLISLSLGDGEDKMGMLKAALLAIFVNLLSKRKRKTAEHESHTAYNAGAFYAGRSVGAATKTWVSERDAKVRPEHAAMHGETVAIYEPFVFGGNSIRYPGDPMAAINLTMNCRCKVRFGF